MENNVVESAYWRLKSFVAENGCGCELITTLKEFIDSVNNERELGEFKGYNFIELKFKCVKCQSMYVKNFRNFKQAKKCCNECSYKSRAIKKSLKIDELKKRLKDKGLELVGDTYEGEGSDITVKCICGNKVVTTYASIRNSKESYMCQRCRSTQLRDLFKFDFEHIKSIFEESGCMLLTKEEEYVNCKEMVRYLARCGHEHKASIDSFKHSKYKMCPTCTREMRSGKNAYNWKGGIYNSESERFRKTYEFKQWVKSVYKRDDYTCQICKKTNCRLNSHHIDGYNWAIDKRVEINNGITLCEDCHNDFHSIYGRGNNTKAQFDEYAVENLRKSSDAGARFLVIEQGKGKTIDYNIKFN